MTAAPAHPAFSSDSAPPTPVFRVEVWPAPGSAQDTIDPLGHALLAPARQTLGPVQAVRAARVYLIEAAIPENQRQRIAAQLLADPVSQLAILGVREPQPDEAQRTTTLEVHYQPGVMDPVAQSTAQAIADLLDGTPPAVRTGFRYDLIMQEGSWQPWPSFVRKFAQLAVANPVIQDIHLRPFTPERFPQPHGYAFQLTHIPIRALDDAALVKMSREAHLFLSLDEMRAIQAYFRGPEVDRDPTDVELETFAQTWSEHCVHKTLKSTIHYRGAGFGSERAGPCRPGHEVHPDGSITIHNLLKSTVAAATHTLMEQDEGIREWCVSVFVDNAGIVKFDDQDAVCIKVETHNHPSAIEPYGGAATGIGGCIRDVMGTGLSAQPIANTNIFAVAPPGAGAGGLPGAGFGDNQPSAISNQQSAPHPSSLIPHPSVSPNTPLPKGVIPPRRILEQVVAGVRDYGNRMGIPTVNGAVVFHDDYIANPLVFAGCVGLIPLDKCSGAPLAGDHIIALGGRTGRDGIHGATFSSAELTDTHAHEFAHAVQIGNAITQKQMMDVILQARGGSGDTPLFHAITDCGAGGFSSAVGEMGEKLGARVHLDRAPLKYAGLSYTEVWISEAQERMVLAVPPENLEKLRALCAAQDVEFCDLGEFGVRNDQGDPLLELHYHEHQVGRLAMKLLHEGIPTPTRQAAWTGPTPAPRRAADPRGGTAEVGAALDALLAHPNIASKHWIIRQYDHEVQGGSVVKPLVGSHQDGPSDAAVLRPKLSSNRAIALGNGLCPLLSEKTSGGDSYWMTLAAIDEAVRNVVCVGADPRRIAILDNFCWPRCEDPAMLGTLVRAAEACYDGALAYRTPFVSGKDSLSNQFTTEDGKLITIPPTLLVTALGMVEDATRCVTMDAKRPGDVLLLVGLTDARMGGSHLQDLGLVGEDASLAIPRVDLHAGPGNARAVAALIARGLVSAAHDCSDGGLLVAAAEMAFAGRVGLDLDLLHLPAADALPLPAACFAETPSRYLLAVAPDQLDAVVRSLRDANVAFGQIGVFASHDRLTLRTPTRGRVLDVALDNLRQTWLGPLDW
jgi:phosphoribosylformylglycinamidine synthase